MKKILIADDDESTRLLVERALRPLGCELIQANTGEEAMALAEQHHPDLLLLDIMMPQGHGYSVCQRIRSHPDLSHMRILFLSSKAYAVDQRHAAELGADGFLTKPFKTVELRETIGRLLAAEEREEA